VLFNMVSALAFHVDRSRTVQPRMADRLSLTFSDSTDIFQTRIIHYLYGGPSGHRARTVRVCADSVLVAHNG
jgi:hypothetical protein